MHIKPMQDEDGEFLDWAQVTRPCPKCRRDDAVYFRLWKSHDGGFEDDQYKCLHCLHIWWIEGPDA